MLETSEGEAELPDLQGVQRIFAHVPLAGTGARLAVGIDRAMVLAKVDQQRVFSLAMLLLVATGSMIGAALAGEVLVLRWLDAVREAAARLGRGDLSVRAPLPPGGELRELAGAFNDMADHLEQRERSRSESEARFRDMAEVSSDWFWETGADHRFTYISQGIHLIGANSSQFIGKRREELASPVKVTKSGPTGLNMWQLAGSSAIPQFHLPDRRIRRHRPLRFKQRQACLRSGWNVRRLSRGRTRHDRSGRDRSRDHQRPVSRPKRRTGRSPGSWPS